MRSGIVYWEEILENIKDATGIENLRPLYNRIRRFVFNVERDIGYGGVIILKKKEYTKGDGFYDGNTIILPDDFVSEWSYGSLNDGIVNGNVYSLHATGADEIDFYYLGFLLDERGNPYTTSNRLDAVVSYAVYRMYSARVFVKEGSGNMLAFYKEEYNDNKLKARGLDAFPTEEDWKSIGRTRLGGTIEAMTNCGMNSFSFNTQLDPYVKDLSVPKPDEVCIEPLYGVANGVATVSGELTFFAKGYMEGAANGATTLSISDGQGLRPAPSAESIYGEANGVTTITGDLKKQIPVIACDESFNKSGGVGTFEFEIDFGASIGMAGIDYNSIGIPDRFRIHWNGQQVANSKFVGNDNYDQELIDVHGIPAEEIATGPGTASGQLLFQKSASSPSKATIYVDAPLGGTAWLINGVCPISAAMGSSSASGTLTPA